MADQEYMGGNLTYADDGGYEEGGGFEQPRGSDWDALARLAGTAEQTQGTMQDVSRQAAEAMAAVTDMQIDQAAEQLVAEFPALNDPQIAESAVAYARQQAALLGLPPTAVQNPQFMRMVMHSVAARSQGQQESEPASVVEQIVRASTSGNWEPDPEARRARRATWGF